MHQPTRAFLRHLIRPIRGGAAGVLIVFSVILAFASKLGFAGLFIGLILTSWLFKYAYILFDHTLRGFDDPPTLDIHMLNPVSEQRPLAQLAILGLIFMGVKYVQSTLGSTAGMVMAAVLVPMVPASVAVLGLEGNILKAVNPIAWIRMVLGLGPLYAAVVGVIAGYACILALSARRGLWLPALIALTVFCILSVFSALGGALFERRHELGLEPWVSPDRTSDIVRAQELRESEGIVTEAYGKMRVGSHTQAWALLQSWLAARGNAPEDYRWLCGRVAIWHEPRFITRLTEDYVDRLLLLKRNGEALDVVAGRLQDDPSFRPRTAAGTLKIAQLAAAGGGTLRVARTLLADFSGRFANDPHAAAAAALARHLEP